MDNIEHTKPPSQGHNLEQDIFFLNGLWYVRISNNGIEELYESSVSKSIIEEKAKIYISNLLPTEDYINKIKAEQYQKELNKGYNVSNDKSNRFGGV